MGSQPYSADDIAEIQKAGDVFRYKLDLWKHHGNGRVLVNGKAEMRNQKSFSKLIYPDKKNPQGQVSKWSQGKARIPADKLDKIIEIFNNDGIPTTREEFRIHSEEEYKYSSEYVNQWIHDHYLWRAGIPHNNIESLRSFLQYLKTIPEYDALFPLWTPLILNDPDLNEGEYNDSIDEWNATVGYDFPIFVRDSYRSLPNAAKSDYPEFQVDKGDDGVKILQDADIHFIEQLMKEVEMYIKHLLQEHKKELDEIASNASSSLYAADYCSNTDDVPYRPSLIQEQKELMKKDKTAYMRQMMLMDPCYFYTFLSKADGSEDDADDNTDEKEGDEK